MNKCIKLLPLICVVVLMTLECNIASARTTNFSMGKALAKGSSEAVAEVNSNYNAFQVGQSVDLPPKTNYTTPESLRTIVGDVNPETVLKVRGNYYDYFRLRGKEQIGGKYFEAKYAHDFNLRSSKYELIPTSILDKPQDSADLILRNKETGQIERKIQQKLSAEEARKAIGNPKYRDCIILIPPDKLAKIKRMLPTYRSPNNNLIEQAINDGILTDNVHGYLAKSSKYYTRKAKRAYYPIYKQSKNAIRVYSTRSIPPIHNLRFAKHAKFIKIGNKIVGIAGSAFEIGYGMYMIYNAGSQFEKGWLDADLANYKKMLGTAQIAVGVVGLVGTIIGGPFDAIVVPVVIVVGVTIAALDMWIDYIQAQRVAARQRMLKRVTAEEKPEAVKQLLLREMEIKCAL